MDSHWFNLPEAFYNNRRQKELSRGGRGELAYMWIIVQFMAGFGRCRSQWVKYGVTEYYGACVCRKPLKNVKILRCQWVKLR